MRVKSTIFGKSLRSLLNEVGDERCGEVGDLENLEGLFVASFGPTIRGVGNRLGEERSGLELWDEGDRSFENKVVEEGGRSTLDKFLDEDESRLGNLEGKGE